jgi:uncharacterized protein (DUF302 family)
VNAFIDSDKPFDLAISALEASVASHGFSVLQAQPISTLLSDRGHKVTTRCMVLEICSPQITARMLDHHAPLGLSLLRRIAVFEMEGKTRMGALPPRMAAEGLERVVERTLNNIMTAAAWAT